MSLVGRLSAGPIFAIHTGRHSHIRMRTRLGISGVRPILSYIQRGVLRLANNRAEDVSGKIREVIGSRRQGGKKMGEAAKSPRNGPCVGWCDALGGGLGKVKMV